MENKKWINKIRQILKQNPKMIKKVFLVLLALGVAITMNHALALPAITTEGALICGQEEHVHNEDCYITETQLICSNEEEVHVHDESCFESEEKFTCTKTEHTHGDNCYQKMEVNNQDSGGIQTYADENTSEQSGKEINLEPFIKDVTIQTEKNNKWQDVPEGTILQEGETVQFTIKYVLDGKTLSSTTDKLFYQLPKEINILKQETGEIRSETGEHVGDYVIDTNGLITLTFFNNNYVSSNMENVAIEGYLSFKSKVSDIQNDGSGKTEIKFKDNLEVILNRNEEKGNSEDLHVTKVAKVSESDKTTVANTITITSEHGTGTHEISVKDVMNNVTYQGDIKIIKNSDGGKSEEVSLDKPISENVSTFDFNLPPLKAGESYTITYKTQAEDPQKAGTVYTSNDVTVTSRDKDDKLLEEKAHAENKIEFKYLEKSYKSVDGNKLEWTIIVNPEEKDIGGMTLSDKFNGKDLSDTKVKIDPPLEGGTSEITLPHTFADGTNKKYTITYTTSADVPIGSNSVKNEAILTKPNPDNPWYPNQVDYVSTPGPVYDSQYWPLSKEVGDLIPSSDETTAEIEWKININADRGEIRGDNGEESWTYTDKLENNQYLTPDQLEDLQNRLNEEYPSYEPLVTGDTEPNGEIKSFNVKFAKPLPLGKTISFSYKSTAILDNTKQNTFKNGGSIENKNWARAEKKYTPTKPTIKKTDRKDTKENTEHNIKDLENGMLSWNIDLTVPDNYKSGDITITEELPKDVSLASLKYRKADNSFQELVPDKQDSNAPFTVTQDQQKIEIIIPEDKANELAKDNIIHFEIYVSINDDFDWKVDEKESSVTAGVFKNSEYVSTEKDDKASEDSQTQTIKKNEHTNIISKSGSTKDNSIVKYSIVVNPEGKDLIPDEDVLLFKDVLSYVNYSSDEATTKIPKQMFLIPGSVKVYDYDSATQTKAEIPYTTEACPYTYKTETKKNNDGHREDKHYLDITIPDGKPLVIEYEYRAIGEKMDGSALYIEINNEASIEGVPSKDDNNTSKVGFNIQDSNAGANLKGITFIKVDEDNTGDELSGAEFKLEMWDKDKNEYVPVQDSSGKEYKLTTVNGRFVLKLEDGDDSASQKEVRITYNTAYRLTETKAPENYIKNNKPYEFYFVEDGKEPDIPDDFAGAALRGGQTVYYSNKSNRAKLAVKKEWIDEDGKILLDPGEVNPVIVNLYQKLKLSDSNSNLKANGSITITAPELKGKDNIWNGLKNDFYQEYPVGTKVTFRLTHYQNSEDNSEVIRINNQKRKMTFEKGPFTFHNIYNDLKTAQNKVYKDFTVTVDQDKEIVLEIFDIYTDFWILEETDVIRSGTENTSNTYPSELDRILWKEIKISNDTDWQWVFEDLPKQVTQNINGKDVVYDCTYVVEEVNGQPIEIVNNDGALSGVITIKNDINNPPPPSDVVLPESGVDLNYNTYLIDFAFTVLASLYLLIALSKMKKQ